MKKVLILGASGLVGKALINEFKNDYDVYGTYFSSLPALPDDNRFKLDVKDPNTLKEILQSVKPDTAISCLRGDYTHQLAFHKELAINITNSPCSLYYFSTTNVFDGDMSRPHSENDTPVAVTDYGKFKIECENMLKENLSEKLSVIRIPAIWGLDSPRLNTIKESLESKKEIDVFSNLVVNNLLDVDLAKQVRFIIENNLQGIFHLCSPDLISQGDFYEQLIRKLGGEESHLNTQVFEGKQETCYFALSSTRSDLPASLKKTNQDIIHYLVP